MITDHPGMCHNEQLVHPHITAHIERSLTGGNRRFPPGNRITGHLSDIEAVVDDGRQKLPGVDPSPLHYPVC